MPQVEQNGSEPSLRAEATNRALAKIGFFRHVLTYATVISGLCLINMWTDARYFWFLWPAIGWGIGLLAHGVNVFAFTEHMLHRMVDRELRKASEHRS